jgi:hypothetical protein
MNPLIHFRKKILLNQNSARRVGTEQILDNFRKEIFSLRWFCSGKDKMFNEGKPMNYSQIGSVEKVKLCTRTTGSYTTCPTFPNIPPLVLPSRTFHHVTTFLNIHHVSYLLEHTATCPTFSNIPPRDYLPKHTPRVLPS